MKELNRLIISLFLAGLSVYCFAILMVQGFGIQVRSWGWIISMRIVLGLINGIVKIIPHE